MAIKFEKDTLAVEQNNYLTEMVNVYTAYDLDGWPRNSTNNLKCKNCLPGATNIVKNSGKEKDTKQHLMVQFLRVLITNLLEML